MAFAPVLVLYGTGDADWVSCLLLDLRSRGVDVVDDGGHRVDAHQVEPRAIVVVRSWLPGGRVEPPSELLESVSSRGGVYIVARRNWTGYERDMRWPRKIYQFALWDDYYQPHRRSSGHGDGGFANVVEVLLERDASIDLPNGYVFISYHHETDGTFVQQRLRPLLSRAALPSWAYRTSERIPDEIVEVRLDELVRRAGVLLVVTTRHWSTFWSNVELEAAHRHGIPVLAVQPAEEPASDASSLAGVPSLILGAHSRTGSALLAALERARRAGR